MEVDRTVVSCAGGCGCCAQRPDFLCDTNQIPSLKLCGPQVKPHGVRGSSNHYHIILYPNYDM